VEPTGSLTAPTVSRIQLLLRYRGDSLLAENTGRCPLLRNGEPMASTELGPGDTLQLGNQYLFVCVRRALFAPREVSYPPVRFGEADQYGIVGETPELWSVRQQLAFIGRREGHVLLRGSSGSGKELAARAIHGLSSRAAKPIVTRNAVTIPESLIDAELFGNLGDYPNKGMPERPGLVGQSHGSTLFLDEIGELPTALQAHLLRVLDHGEYHRLGESKTRISDFRLIGATNRPDAALKHDLFARFGFFVDLPDLNRRREDIPLLIRFLLGRMVTRDAELKARFAAGEAGFPKTSLALVRALVEHEYSSNVRELEALLWKALMSSEGNVIDLPQPDRRAAARSGAIRPDDGAIESPRAATSEVDAEAPSPARIQAVLDEHNGVIEQAWKALGLRNRYVLARLITKHGIEVRRRRGRQLRRPSNRAGSR
jgi:DNA-binding NtrC family response regulator